MSGSSTMAKPTRVRPRPRAISMATSLARRPLAEPSRQTRMSSIIAAPSWVHHASEEHQSDDRKQRHQHRERPEQITEEARHSNMVLLGNRFHHEVWTVADIGNRAHEHRAARDGDQQAAADGV